MIDMNNNRVVFSYTRTLCWLTMILFVAFIIVLRGSSWPLLIDNAFTRWLFLSEETADKTLYNIGISYIAAYIFYLVQIYFPERKKTQMAIVQTSLDMLNCIRQCKYFIRGWKDYTERQNGVITVVNIRLIYYEDSCGHIIQMTPEFLKETVQRILADYDCVKNNFMFRQSDIELQKMVLEMDLPQQVHEWFTVLESARILCENPDSTIMESYSDEDLKEFEKRLEKLARTYGFNNCLQLEQTEDKEKIFRHHRIMKSGYDVVKENLDYFKNLPDGYNKPVREGDPDC